MSKRNILISASDFKRLRECLRESLYDGDAKDRPHVRELREELVNATIITDPKEVPPDVITMRSRVRLRDLDSGESLEYSLVYPSESNAEAARISVLAPIGVGMLGYRVGDTIEWEVPRGRRRLCVEEILYQPESAGDYHL